MVTHARNNATILIKYLQTLDRTRKKLELAYTRGHITKRDLERVYDGLYVNAIGAFENELENIFFGLVLGKLRVTGKVRTRATFSSPQTARKIIYGGQPFLKWLPYENTKKTAYMYIVDGHPFSRLEQTDFLTLKSIVSTRNAVAHKSRSAMARFEQDVIGNLSLMRGERTPAGYLRGVFRISPHQTRYERDMIFLAQTILKITK